MKAEFLKIAKCKTDKQFYDKYPSEAAFFKAHPEAKKLIKKAQVGVNIPFEQSLQGMNTPEWYNDAMSTTTDTTTLSLPQTVEGNKQALLKQFGIGAQTMGKMKGAPAIQQPPINSSDPNFMNKNTEGAPYEASNVNKNYTGYQGEINNQTGGGGGFMDAVGKYAGPAGDLIKGYQALRGERREKKSAEQNLAITDVMRRASATREEESERKYVRPEDVVNTGEEFFPIYGVGTNPIARNGMNFRDGGGISGNPTEIQNTYNNQYDIYTDGGYEPLNDSDVKQYYHGGRLHSMQDGGGMSPDMYGQIGGIATNLGQSAMGGQNAGGQIGGTLGKTAGTAIGGPIGGMVGEVAGGLIGNALDKNAKKIKKLKSATESNINAMALNSGFQGLQSMNNRYVRNGGDIPSYEEGGYMNPEYNPQVITMFGDHNAQDFADYAHKDQYRAGGHLKAYTPPSERAMETYRDGGGVKSHGLGGELQTHWGGGAETLSHNPYLPGTGETVMFRGKSHEEYSPNGETGIGVTYGGNPVEVERGEPMVELEEGGTVDPMTGEVQKSGVVFGNLKIPNQYIDMLGDKSAKGQKFKNYVAKLSKGEEKQNKLIEKTTNELDGFVPQNSFDKLKLSALQASIQGANMKLKDIADKKINAAALQNAINDTAEENGLVADDLARGKVKIDKEAMKSREARWGDAIEKAASGKTVTTETTKFPTSFKDDAEAKSKGFTWTGKYGPDGKTKEYKRTVKTFSDKKSETKDANALDYVPAGQKQSTSGTFGKVTPETFAAAKAANSWYPGWSTLDPKNKADVKTYQRAFNARAKAIGSSAHIDEDGDFGEQTVSARIEEDKKSEPASAEEEYIATVPGQPDVPATPAKAKFPWQAYANQALQYLRPSDQEGLDASQLYPEMYAMASNQLQPVPAQGYQPEIGVPYDISYQDQLNANQADYRAAQRTMGYNPAAQANLNAQKYTANTNVLGEQFRANQAMKDKVYGENRNILNDAKLKNLAIYDQQYGRQAEALSNTKATTLAALSSISDKYAKNKLENRTLGVMENMYNYRFDDKGRAVNMNPLAQFNWEGRETSGKESAPEGYEYETILKKKKKEEVAKNGSIVKSYKNI